MKMKARSKRNIHLDTPPASKQYKAGKDNIWTKLAFNLIRYQIKKTAKKLKNAEKNAERYSIKQS